MYKRGEKVGKFIVICLEPMEKDERITAYRCYDTEFKDYCYITPNTLKWVERYSPVFEENTASTFEYS